MNTIKKTRTLDISREKLINILTNPEFEVARETKANGSLEAKVKELSRTDSTLEYEIQVKEYAKGVTGIDKSKTENNTYTYKWDLKNYKADWTYKMSSHGGSVKVFGSIVISDKGGKSQLDNAVNVEIKIPLIGGKIEKKVLSEIENGWPNYDRIVDEWLQKA